MIYLDNAASTRCYAEVVEEMNKFLLEDYGNPESNHRFGKKVDKAIKEAREKIASILGCKANEIVFTSSGTEAVQLAIPQGHIVTTAVEHLSVLDKAKDATILNVDKYGIVSVDDVKNAIREDTKLVSIIYANNEIGTINNIKELAKVAHENGVLFHTDACQAGLLNLKLDELGVDLMSLNGSKINGPKGIGVLYNRGGKMEEAKGTPNVAGIIGFTKALEITQTNKGSERERLRKLSSKLIEGLALPKSFLNGHNTQRLPQIVNLTFEGIEARSLLELLEEKGVVASTGSACTSNSLEPSHVLKAIGLSDMEAHGTIRFSLGIDTTEEDIDAVIPIVKESLEELRLKC